MCSSKITVGNALQKALEMSNIIMDEGEEITLMAELTMSMSDESIVHQAV